MAVATVIWLVYLLKIFNFKDTCIKEYKTVVPCSLYAGYFMMLMILASFYYEYNQTVGLVLWFVAWICHAIHICIFTYRNVIKERNINTFVPSWFVTYNGVMVLIIS